MGLLSFLMPGSESEVKKYSKLYDSLQLEFPDLEEEQLVITSCIAGLMARVAYTDFDLDEKEVEQMRKNLVDWKVSDKISQDQVVDMAVKHIKEMAGLENHLYVHPLKKFLTKDERYKVVQSLFLVAASDGSVENIESQEIKLITKGLELSTQHFLAARAEVVEFINALR